MLNQTNIQITWAARLSAFDVGVTHTRSLRSEINAKHFSLGATVVWVALITVDPTSCDLLEMPETYVSSRFSFKSERTIINELRIF